MTMVMSLRWKLCLDCWNLKKRIHLYFCDGGWVGYFFFARMDQMWRVCGCANRKLREGTQTHTHTMLLSSPRRPSPSYLVPNVLRGRGTPCCYPHLVLDRISRRLRSFTSYALANTASDMITLRAHKVVTILSPHRPLGISLSLDISLKV